MNFGGGYTHPQENEFQFRSSWVPAPTNTPIPLSTMWKNQLGGATNWQENAGYQNGYVQDVQNFNSNGGGVQSLNPQIIHGLDGGLNNRDVGFPRRNRVNNIGLTYPQPPNNYSLADILSTKNVATDNSTQTRSIHAESRHLTQNFQAQANQYQFQTNNIGMSHANHDYYQIQSLLNNGESFTALLQDEFPDPYTPVHNLNSPPKTVTDATHGIANSFYFAPVTPDQTKNSESNRHLNLSVDESSWFERNGQDLNNNNIVPVLENEVVVHHNDELLQNIVDSSSAVNATREIIKDNGDKEIDLNQSPLQKTPKRRKHRPKVIIEGKPKRTPKPAAAPQNPGSEQNPTVKRKYTRKTGLKPETTKPEDHPAVKSCRRALSFDLEKKVDESESILVNQLQEKRHGTVRHFDLNLEFQAIEQYNETDNMLEKISAAQINQNNKPVEREKQEAPKFNLTNYRDHIQNNCSSQAPQATLIDLTTDDSNSMLSIPNTYYSGVSHISQRSDYSLVDQQNIYAEGPKRIFLQAKDSNAILEKKGQLMLQRSFQNIADSNKERMLKRKHHPAMEECTHRYTATLNSLLRQEVFQVNGYTKPSEGFLDTQKKIKSGSGLPTNYKNTSNRVDQNLFTSKINHGAVNSHFENRNTQTKMSKGVVKKYIGDGYHVTSQHDFALQDNSPTLLCHRSNTVKRQSNGSTKVDNITSRAMIESINYLPLPCPKILTASVLKETTKEPTLSIMTSANVLLRENRKEKQIQLSAVVPKGPSKRQPYLISIDELISRLEGLKINGQMRNKTVGQEKNALVPYKGNGAIVSYERLLKKRQPRPKVDLDQETDRQWKRLMGKEPSEPSEGTNKDKEKWWEEERKVFRGRADSFIARMHLVQGDRRFSRWKGSVVDSVIGVFLTQNVSDHLSSSAFMDLAAKFPVTVSTNDRSCYGQPKPILVEEPEVYILESNLSEKVPSSRPIYNQNHIISEQSLEHSREILNNIEAKYLPTMEDLLYKNSNYGALGWQETSRVGPSAVPNNHYMRQQNSFHPETSKENNQYSCKNVRHERATNNRIELADKVVEQNVIEKNSYLGEKGIHKKISTNSNAKKGKVDVEKTDWDALRREVQSHGKRERLNDAIDSMDYEAFRCADVNEIAMCIIKRGMNHMLADRMKDFLNRLVREHGSMDLEWLRDAPPDQTKNYLLSIRGLGIKSVECVRLLTLHQLAFPVDTNVGRIAVRLGWVPLQPLPESLQLHLLEMYPVLESIQKYIWPRLCKLDQRTLYELHYQMITFGKVFCTKSKPNCNACPMRAECRHFASAFASARLALPGPEEKSIVNPSVPFDTGKNHKFFLNPMPLLEPGETSYSREPCEPIIEEPATPEPEFIEISESDIEDAFYEDPDKIPTIKLNIEEFTQNLQNYMSYEVQDGDISNAIVALNTAAASFPTPKLKSMSRLRTEHQVYELPDSHPLLEGLERRERDDPSPYLLAIWTPGENADSTQPPEKSFSEHDENSTREANLHTVLGTLLIPCRTAMRGSFPLNGTYFQVNEMFADHESSLVPINVPRAWIWNLPRRAVYFGTSVSSIFRGLSTEGIQYCFWRGFVCVRGFEQKMRAPRPLQRRFHSPASKVVKKQNNET